MPGALSFLLTGVPGGDDVDDKTGKAFDYAQEVVKQLITLATAIIALTITFGTDVFENLAGQSVALRLVRLSWAAFILSVPIGVFALMKLTGELNKSAPRIMDSGVRLFAGAQIVLFLVGLALTLAYGIESLP